MEIKNKIGYIDNKNLPGLEKVPGGHYVLIRQDNKNGTCNVNVITSLETSKEKYQPNKLRQVRKGNTYSIPYYDANFTKWSGVTRKIITDIPIDKLTDVGKKKIDYKHLLFIERNFK